MNDIVERLRMQRSPMLDGERAEAADEIEHLRTVLWDETEKRVLLTKEVERLRGSLREFADIAREKDSEIKQLRKVIAIWERRI